MTFSLIATTLLSAFSLFASSIKIFGRQKMVFEAQLAMLESCGFNRQSMMLVGLAEFFGSVAMWFPGVLGALAPLALLGTSVGAINCHLRFDTSKQGVPAMITGAFSAVLAWERQAVLTSLF